MSNLPKITVVLPCYNAHEFLQRTLDSLRNQTFQDFETIIVDDGSTKSETIGYLDALPNDIRLIRQQNRGLGAARNRGFAEARAPYVLPLDCDDWIAPAFLADAYRMIQEAPEGSFIFPDLTLEEEMIGTLRKTYNLFEQFFFNQLPYCMLIPRTSWLAIGGYDETMRHGYEDWDFNIRLGLKGYSGIAMGKPHFHYRVSSSGMLASSSQPRHIELWRHIRSKHRDAYTLKGLAQSWQKWRRTDSIRPLYLYFFWELLFRLFPDYLFAAVFRAGLPWSHSMRITRQQGAAAARTKRFRNL